MKKHLANLVTGCRILCGAGMLFCSVFSRSFYVLYLLGGFTDMIDGTIARRTSTVTAFGSKLDSAADLVFIGAACVKLLPVISLPGWVWGWGILIVILRVCNGKFWLDHTALNKMTGCLLFLLPLTLSFLDVNVSACLVCTAATLAVLQEMHTKTPAR